MTCKDCGEPVIHGFMHEVYCKNECDIGKASLKWYPLPTELWYSATHRPQDAKKGTLQERASISKHPCQFIHNNLVIVKVNGVETDTGDLDHGIGVEIVECLDEESTRAIREKHSSETKDGGHNCKGW